MSPQGANIPIAVDAKEAIRGGKQVEGALEGVIDSLDDVSDAAKDTDKSTSKSLDSIGDEGEKQADRLTHSFKDSLKEVEKQSKKSGDKVGKNIKEGTDGASEGLSEMGSEAQSTSAEVAASFDGSAESIAGGFQELAANAFAGFGPAGALAGAAAAAGIGIALSKLQEAADAANELAEESVAFSLSMRDAGDAAGRVQVLRDRWDEVGGKIADAKKMWEIWQPKAVTNIEQFAKAAKTGGINITDMFDAFTDPNPVRRLEALKAGFGDVKKATKDADDAIYRYNTTQRKATDDDTVVNGLIAKREALKDTSKAYKDEIALAEAAATVTEAQAKAEGLSVEAYLDKAAAVDDTRTSTERYAEALAVSTTALQENLDKQNAAADAARGLWDAETQLAGAVAAATTTLQENKDAGLDPATEGGRANRDALSQVAGAYDAAAEAIKAQGGTQAEANAKTEEGRQAVKDLAAQLGITEEDAKKYADQLGLIPVRIDTELALQVQKQGYEEARAKYDGLGKPITVAVSADTTSFDRTMRQLQDGSYSAYVNGRPVGNRAE